MRFVCLALLAACGSSKPPPTVPVQTKPLAATSSGSATLPLLLDDDDRGPCFVLTLDTHRVPEPTGQPVTIRVFDPPKACSTLAPRAPVPSYSGPQNVPGDETGLQVFDSQKEWQTTFRCAPGIDFATSDLGLVWNDHSGESRF